MTNSVENLISVLTSHGELPGQTQEWLVDGLFRYVAEGCSLEQALGLNGGVSGQKKVATLLRESKRNYYLLQAWNKVSNDRISFRQRSEKLNVAINRFITSRWQELKYSKGPPPGNLSALSLAIYFCLKAGAPLPTTARGLDGLVKRILENKEQMIFHEPML